MRLVGKAERPGAADRHAQAAPGWFAAVSLRRFLAGPVSFGLTLGMAIVALMLEGWALDPFPFLALAAWGAALVATGLTFKFGWPVFHVTGAGCLLVASAALVDTALWPLPLAAAVVAMGMARFASVGFASRWLSRAVAAAAAGGLAWMAYGAATGSGAWADVTLQEGLVAGLSLLVIVVLGLWFRDDDEE